MIVSWRGCSIVIPTGAGGGAFGKFDARTSYADKLTTRLRTTTYRKKKLPAKLECLYAIKDRMQALGGYSSYFEPFAGVGLSARLFAPTGTVALNDFDVGCAEALRSNFPSAIVTVTDAEGLEFPRSDLIFTDFNAFTLKRFRGGDNRSVLDRAFDASQRFLLINDCSVFYFRYGKQSFDAYSRLMGVPICSVEDYFEQVRREYSSLYPRWSLAHVAYFTDSSFQLFYRGDASLGLTKIVAPVLEVSVGDGVFG